MVTTEVMSSYSQQRNFEKVCAMLLLTIVPHSMQTERMISVYNKIASPNRQSMKIETVNWRMHIALNGKSTAKYDARQTMVKFLNSKERRQRESNYGVHEKRKFICKFFR